MLEPFGDNNVSTETFINFEENCYDFSSGWDTIQASVDYNGDEEGGIPTWSSTYTNSPSHLESSPSRVPTESSEQIDFFQQCSDQSKNLDLSWPDEPLDTSEMPLSWIDPSLSSCFPSVTDTESRFLPGNNTTQRTVLSSAPDPSIANYICEYCSETYAKQHLLKYDIFTSH